MTDEITNFGEYLYTNIGYNGQSYKGEYLFKESVNGCVVFIFKVSEYKEDLITRCGEWRKIDESCHKDYPYIVGTFSGNEIKHYADGQADVYVRSLPEALRRASEVVELVGNFVDVEFKD